MYVYKEMERLNASKKAGIVGNLNVSILDNLNGRLN